MSDEHVIRAEGGASFEDGPDRGRILVFGAESGGRYSLMDYIVAPRPPTDAPDFGPHRHLEIEETFLVRRGRLRFLLGEDVFDLGPGDFVRAPPGMRHGFANVCGEAVELLVSFHPGGFETLFIDHRTDQEPPPSPTGFMDEARRRFASEFEPPAASLPLHGRDDAP
ncbi:MAG TPA: cupin domain-containing protein [Caulobacteraceae bacterium]|nr:cupin domain-containing protein [Caulobacteraceae bacterium]